MEPHTMSEQPATHIPKNLVGVILTIAIMIGIVGGAFYYFRATHPSAPTDHPSSARVQRALKDSKLAPYYRDLVPPEASVQSNPGIATAPEFRIGRYKVASRLPPIPVHTQLFTFKTSFPENEVQQLSTKLLGGVNPVNVHGDIKSYSNGLGYFNFNGVTGAFEFQSAGLATPFELKTIDDIRPHLTAFLRNELGVIDDTVTLTAYYQQSTTPQLTFYEFHRDPEKVGLQIVNPVGAANLAEDVSLASDPPEKARRADFNALTVAITDEGKIVSIESSLRPIEKTELIGNLNFGILSPEQALFEAEHNGSYFNISIPAGEGTIQYDKVYLNNQLRAQEATITDVGLIYIEKPPSVRQRFLQPAYLIRGYAETDSGVRVKFVQTVPALENLEPIADNSFMDIIGIISGDVFAQEDQNIYQIIIPCGDGTSQRCTFETFRNTPTLVPTSSPTGIRAKASPTPQPPTTTQSASPTPTPTGDTCAIYNLSGDLIEQGRPIYVIGVGTIYYFSNLPSGPLVIENSLRDPQTDPNNSHQFGVQFDTYNNIHLNPHCRFMTSAQEMQIARKLC